MDDRKVTVPLMLVRTDDDIQFVEEDNDTISENEISSASKRNADIHSQECEPVYNELTPRETKGFLGVPKLSAISRSTSSASSDNVPLPMLFRSSSNKKKNHDYEKVSVGSKKSAVERITDSSFFRRRHETMLARSDKSDDEEHILEAMRHIVRKCTSIDPMKRPTSSDVMDLLSTFDDKS